MRESAKLTPEQRKAIQMFRSCTIQQSSLQVERILIEHVTTTDCKIFVTGKIGRKSLPHDPHWVWNQSKAQITIESTSTHEIIMKKLNPRKKHKNQPQGYPSYKLWVFVIKHLCGQEVRDNLNFIWCEKGCPAESKVVENSSSATDNTNIDFKEDFFQVEFASLNEYLGITNIV